MYSVRAYGATASVNVKESLNSCGVRQVEQFHIQGDTSNLSFEQADKMLKELFRKVRLDYKHVLVAADAVGPRGWSGAGGNTSRCDALSLARFCEVNGFIEVPNGINPNNQHEIRVYVSHFHSLDSKGNFVEGRRPPAQDFSDDSTRPASSSDAKKYADAIIAFLES